MYNVVRMMEEVGLLPMPGRPQVTPPDDHWCSMAAEAELDFPDIMRWYTDKCSVDWFVAKCKRRVTQFCINHIVEALKNKLDHDKV